MSKLVTALNQNVVKVETSATTTYLERETLSKLHKAFFNQPFEFYEKYLFSTEGNFGKNKYKNNFNIIILKH